MDKLENVRTTLTNNDTNQGYLFRVESKRKGVANVNARREAYSRRTAADH